jgi:predicted esterase YcpF (UPF0227 family)
LKTIFYLHGYNSSPQSHKAQLCGRYFQHCQHAGQALIDYQVPQLSYAPALAIAQLQSLIANAEQPLLIGSSLGGYYANYLAQQFDCKAVLINPAIYPDHLLVDYLGPQRNDYTGETYTLSEQHMIELQALSVDGIRQPEQRWVLLQTGDETLDYSQASAYYRRCKTVIEYGGDHSFQNFARWLPAITDFLIT